jgi:hypothetical protein
LTTTSIAPACLAARITPWVIWAGRRGILVSHSTVLPIAAVTMPPRDDGLAPPLHLSGASYLRIPRPDDLQICPSGVAPWPLEKARAAGEAACIVIGFSHDDKGAGADSTQPQFR